MLALDDIHSYYGKSHVLFGVSLSVDAGELVTLLGRNGAGKTTTLKSIMRLVRPRAGTVYFCGQDLSGFETYQIAYSGIILVPEHRGIFASLTVEENLAIAARSGSKWNIEDVYRIFPRLCERRASGGGALSGGEQQMLAIARGLVCGPKLLLLDEPMEGLSPLIVRELTAIIARIRDSGVGILMVEQNIRVCSELGDRHYILEDGRIVYSGTREQFSSASDIRDFHLSLKADPRRRGS